MFPIRDTVPSRNLPVVTWLLILTNSLDFLVEMALPPPLLERFLIVFGQPTVEYLPRPRRSEDVR